MKGDENVEKVTKKGEETPKISVELTEEQLSKLKEIEQRELEVQAKEVEVSKKLKEISDWELIKESKKTAKTLKETQKMVTIVVPISEMNPKDLNVPVTINGFTWNIKRGEEVEVPEEVKNILKEAKYI